MPKKPPELRHLVSKPRAGGRMVYKWEPTAAMRAAGWATVTHGYDYVAAVEANAECNRLYDAWRAGAPASGESAPNIAPANRLHATWADLDRAFRHDEKHGLPSKSLSTQKEYRSRMKWLKAWAENGRTRLSHIDDAMAENLRDTLVEQCSAFKAASIMRVFSLLMTYAEKRAKMIAKGKDPSKALNVPTPPRRTTAISYHAMLYLARIARHMDMERMALAVELGFLCVQRQADWRVMRRTNWREMHDLDAADRAILCGPDGKVFGARIKQGKTGTWVGCPVDHGTRLKVEARIARMHNRDFDYILYFDGNGHDPEGLWESRQFNRDWNTVKSAAIAAAQAEGDSWMVDQLTAAQYRDLRRSGMCWMRDMGATKEQIAARSGHSIEEVEDILKTYMPTNERGSGAAFARAFATSQQRSQERNVG